MCNTGCGIYFYSLAANFVAMMHHELNEKTPKHCLRNESAHKSDDNLMQFSISGSAAT
jgi:hypothetical protein